MAPLTSNIWRQMTLRATTEWKLEPLCQCPGNVLGLVDVYQSSNTCTACGHRFDHTTEGYWDVSDIGHLPNKEAT